jgi:hypothetical protein
MEVNSQEYLKEMSKTSTWGSAVEIKAFCELFDMNVLIHPIGLGTSKTD